MLRKVASVMSFANRVCKEFLFLIVVHLNCIKYPMFLDIYLTTRFNSFREQKKKHFTLCMIQRARRDLMYGRYHL